MMEDVVNKARKRVKPSFLTKAAREIGRGGLEDKNSCYPVGWIKNESAIFVTFGLNASRA
jgi:hypothetical protein